MNPNCSTVRYLGWFLEPCTRREFSQVQGVQWANATIWRFRAEGWIASDPRGWVLTEAGREQLTQYLACREPLGGRRPGRPQLQLFKSR